MGIDKVELNVFILGNIREETILAFLVYLTYYKHNGISTRKRILYALKSFYKWLFIKYHKILLNKINPTLEISIINDMNRLPKYLKLNDAITLQSIFNEDNCKNSLRNNTILVIFLNCALRLSELINLDKADINLDEGQVRVIGKGKKERIIYLSEKVIKQLKRYLSSRNDNYTPLFLNHKNERLGRRSVQSICKKAFELANLSEHNYSVHSLRHTCATYMYESTNDILVVREFLGHSTVISTEIYTHLSNKRLKEAIDKHPLNFI